MDVRNIAAARRRGFGGFTAFAAAFALLAAGPTSALASSEASLSSSKTILALSLARAVDGEGVLAVRGASVGSDSSRYSVAAALAELPCPGAYRYDLQSENQQTGAQSAYSALVVLTPLPAGQASLCGAPLPARRGTLRISISDEGEPIDVIHANSSGSAEFFGGFTTTAQPECEKRYLLSAAAELRGWTRSVRYRLKVVRWKAEAQGLPLENHPYC